LFGAGRQEIHVKTPCNVLPFTAAKIDSWMWE